MRSDRQGGVFQLLHRKAKNKEMTGLERDIGYESAPTRRAVPLKRGATGSLNGNLGTRVYAAVRARRVQSGDVATEIGVAHMYV